MQLFSGHSFNYLIPPTGYFNVFYDVECSSCILRVHKGCKVVYQEADIWKNFPQIEEVSFGYQVAYMVDGDVYLTDSIGCGNPITFPTKEGYTYVPKGDVCLILI